MKKILVVVLMLVISLTVNAQWTAKANLDDFKEPTGSYLLIYMFEDEHLDRIILNQSIIGILCKNFEFSWRGENSVKLSIKTKDGKIYDFFSDQETNGSAVFIKDAQNIIKILKKEKSIKIALAVNADSYVTNVDCSSFSEMYSKYLKK